VWRGTKEPSWYRSAWARESVLLRVGSVLLRTSEQLGEPHRTDVPAGDHDADVLAAHAAGKQSRDADRAARLDDELHPVEEEGHGIDDLGVAHRDDLVDALPVHRERQLTRLGRLQPIGDRGRYLDADAFAGREGSRGVVARLRLDADHAGSRPKRFRHGRATGDQAAPAALEALGLQVHGRTSKTVERA